MASSVQKPASAQETGIVNQTMDTAVKLFTLATSNLLIIGWILIVASISYAGLSDSKPDCAMYV